MKRTLVPLILLGTTASLAAAAEDAPWTWAGLEILGNHEVARGEIEKLIPVPIGGAWHRGDAPFWSDACAGVKKRFDFASVDCGDRPLRVFDGRKAYLIVDIVEKGRERLLKFNDAPTGSVPFGNDEMLAVSATVDSKTMAAAMAGHGYNERGDKGYLSYDVPAGADDDLLPLVDRLAQLVPAYRENLLEILQRDKDPGNRQTAANLLNWSGGDLEKTLRRVLPLLLDPDDAVRNNLSRFTMHFVGKVNSVRLRHRLITAFIDQIERPSHGDRNKGLYNLLGIAQSIPDDRAFMWSRGEKPIRYLADNSILFNVQGPARELLALIDPAARPGCAGSP